MGRRRTEEIAFVSQELLKFATGGPDTVIHYVTSRCNAACAHCFFSDRLNRKDDLKPEEHVSIASKAGPLRALLIGGGEPFLAAHLADLVVAYHKKSGVRFVQVPTTGFQRDAIVAFVDRTGREAPDLNLTVQVSIDGFAGFHDANRRLPGLFDAAVGTLTMLAKAKARFPRLRVGVASVLVPGNAAEIVRLAEFLKDEADIDGHSLEIVRDKGITVEDLGGRRRVSEIIDYWRGLHRHYYLKDRRKSPNPYFSAVLRRGFLKLTLRGFSVAARRFLEGKRWPFPCVAGRRIAVIYPDGGVAACELRLPAGNIRTSGFDLLRLMNKPEFKAEVAAIARDRCFCTHGCFIPPSIRYSPLELARLAIGGA